MPPCLTELELCPPVSPAGADIYPCLARKSKKTFALLLVSNEGFMVQRL